jgi:paraquat-inducible protein B
MINLEPQRFEVLNLPANYTPYSVMEEMVKRGLRAQLQPANLLTGELLVALDFFPNAQPATLDRSGKVPRIPSMPTNFEVLSTKATAILDKVAALPLDQLINELRSTVRSADTLVSVQATKSLDQLAPLLKTLQQASEQAKLALAQADATMKSANSMIGDDSRLRYDLIRMVKELSETARSLRALASSVERQPQQVIFGKDGEGNQ